MPAMLASGFDQGTLPSRSRGNRHVQGDFGKNRRNLEVFFVKLRAGRSLYVDSIRRNTCCECELNDYNSYADKARPGLRSSSADPDPRFPHRRFGSTRFDRGRFDFALRSGVRRLRRMPLRGKHFFHGLHLGETPERPVDQLIETLLEGELVRQPPADGSRGCWLVGLPNMVLAPHAFGEREDRILFCGTRRTPLVDQPAVQALELARIFPGQNGGVRPDAVPERARAPLRRIEGGARLGSIGFKIHNCICSFIHDGTCSFRRQ